MIFFFIQAEALKKTADAAQSANAQLQHDADELRAALSMATAAHQEASEGAKEEALKVMTKASSDLEAKEQEVLRASAAYDKLKTEAEAAHNAATSAEENVKALTLRIKEISKESAEIQSRLEAHERQAAKERSSQTDLVNHMARVAIAGEIALAKSRQRRAEREARLSSTPRVRDRLNSKLGPDASAEY